MNKNIIIVSLATSTSFLFLMYIIMLNKFKNAFRALTKLSVDNAVMQEYIDIIQSKESPIMSEELVDKENFIKFLSDSRDWAYKYIEDVQLGLTEFINEIEPDMSYFAEYGEVGSAYPHYNSMEKILKEYTKLKKLLPTEEKK